MSLPVFLASLSALALLAFVLYLDYHRICVRDENERKGRWS